MLREPACSLLFSPKHHQLPRVPTAGTFVRTPPRVCRLLWPPGQCPAPTVAAVAPVCVVTSLITALACLL